MQATRHCQDDEQGNVAHALGGIRAQGIEHRREDRADEARRLAPDRDPSALGIVPGQFRAPREIGREHHGPAEGQQEQPDREAGQTGPGARYEEHPGRQHHQRRARGEPGATTAPAGGPPVAGDAGDRIAHGVEQARGDEDRPDRAKRQAVRGGVELRQKHVDREVHRRQRQRGRGVGGKNGWREGLGRVGHGRAVRAAKAVRDSLDASAMRRTSPSIPAMPLQRFPVR